VFDGVAAQSGAVGDIKTTLEAFAIRRAGGRDDDGLGHGVFLLKKSNNQ
jgi:hypothetical protein